MKTEYFFKLSDDLSGKKRTAVIESIPLKWHFLVGTLRAPQGWITRGDVTAYDTKVIIRGSTVAIESRTKGVVGNGAMGLAELFVERRAIESVGFDYVGGGGLISVQSVKPFVIGLLDKGYVGNLRFISLLNSSDELMSEVAFCDIKPEPWVGPSYGEALEAGAQPARVRIGWDEFHHGREEHVAEILDTCRKHCEEYTPQPITA